MSRPTGRPWLEVLAVAAAVVAYVSGLWLARGEPGMDWDEPYYVDRAEAIAGWLGRAVGPPAGRARLFDRNVLEQGWQFCREPPSSHGPVPCFLGLAANRAFGRLVGPLRGYRLGTVLAFAIAAGVLFRLVRQRWGWPPALVALGTLLTDPRPLSDAQQFTADSNLGAVWFLAAVAGLRACETGRGAWRFGVLAGLAVMSKVMGVLLLPAMVGWMLIYRPRNARRVLAWAVPTVPLTMIAVNPYLWPHPVAALLRWGRSFLAFPQKVPVAYFGTVYDSRTKFLPWHNPAVLTGTMVPPGLLALAAVGLVAAAWLTLAGRNRRSDPGVEFLPDAALAGWATLNFLILPVLRVSSFMPAHDGLRQLDPAFFFVPILAALGARTLLRAAGRSRVGAGLAGAVILISLGSAAWATVRIQPFGLAYYNAFIGGPRGAKAAGMETTYYWDAANAEVLGWMDANLPTGATVLIFPPPDVRMFDYHQRWGTLRPDLKMMALDPPHFERRLALMRGKRPCYLIFLMRQGLYLRFDFASRLADAPALYSLSPARVDGVRLLAIFDRAQYRAAVGRDRPQ